jgi:hypothetical protein
MFDRYMCCCMLGPEGRVSINEHSQFHFLDAAPGPFWYACVVLRDETQCRCRLSCDASKLWLEHRPTTATSVFSLACRECFARDVQLQGGETIDARPNPKERMRADAPPDLARPSRSHGSVATEIRVSALSSGGGRRGGDRCGVNTEIEKRLFKTRAFGFTRVVCGHGTAR